MQKAVSGNNQYQGAKNTHLPLKVNSAGVIPVIFASAFFNDAAYNCAALP